MIRKKIDMYPICIRNKHELCCVNIKKKNLVSSHRDESYHILLQKYQLWKYCWYRRSFFNSRKNSLGLNFILKVSSILVDFQSTNTSECIGWWRSWWFSDVEDEEDVDALHPSFDMMVKLMLLTMIWNEPIHLSVLDLLWVEPSVHWWAFKLRFPSKKYLMRRRKGISNELWIYLDTVSIIKILVTQTNKWKKFLGY